MAALSTKLARMDAASRERVRAPRLRQSPVPPRAVQVPRSLGGATVLLVADVQASSDFQSRALSAHGRMNGWFT